jgi:hypothetical protein
LVISISLNCNMNERIKSYIYCNFIPKGNIMTGVINPVTSIYFSKALVNQIGNDS